MLATGQLGTVGNNAFGQCNFPAGLQNVTTLTAGFSSNSSAAINADSTLVMWGDNTSGQCNVPIGLGNVRAVGLGEYVTTAIVTIPNSDLYVAGNFGSDTTGDGTANNPYQTVTKALSLVPASAPARVTIHINTGNYPSDKPRITKNVKLVNWTSFGLVRIGEINNT